MLEHVTRERDQRVVLKWLRLEEQSPTYWQGSVGVRLSLTLWRIAGFEMRVGSRLNSWMVQEGKGLEQWCDLETSRYSAYHYRF